MAIWARFLADDWLLACVANISKLVVTEECILLANKQPSSFFLSIFQLVTAVSPYVNLLKLWFHCSIFVNAML